MRDITIDDLRQIKNEKLIELSSPNAVAYHNALVDKVSNTIHSPKFRRKIMSGYKRYLKYCNNITDVEGGYKLELFVCVNEQDRRALQVFIRPIINRYSTIVSGKVRKQIGTGVAVISDALDVTTWLVPQLNDVLKEYSFIVDVSAPVKENWKEMGVSEPIGYFGWSTIITLTFPDAEDNKLVLGGSGKGHKWTTTK
jgi:hypothetical protein